MEVFAVYVDKKWPFMNEESKSVLSLILNAIVKMLVV